MNEILGIEHWPSMPGHGGSTTTWRGWRKATSEDGRYWLVRKRGPFRRWSWRPVNGMYVRLAAAHRTQEGREA